MAEHTVARSKHFTLTASGTVDVVIFESEPQKVEVLNRGTTDPVYFVTGSGDQTNPSVAGDNTLVVPAGQALVAPLQNVGATRVELIAATGVAVSVTAVD